MARYNFLTGKYDVEDEEDKKSKSNVLFPADANPYGTNTQDSSSTTSSSKTLFPSDANPYKPYESEDDIKARELASQPKPVEEPSFLSKIDNELRYASNKILDNPLAKGYNSFIGGMQKAVYADKLAKWINPNSEVQQRYDEAMQENPKTAIAGQITGSILPASKASNLSAKILAPTLQNTGKIKSLMATETLAGAGLGAIDDLVNGNSNFDKTKEYAGFGALGGATFGSIGKAYNGIKNARNDLKNFDSIFEPPMQGISKDVSNIPYSNDMYKSKADIVTEQLRQQPLMLNAPKELQQADDIIYGYKPNVGISDRFRGNYKPNNPLQTKVMEDRTTINVGDKRINSYQYDNPDIKPFFKDYSEYILNTEFVPNEKYQRVSEVMTKLKKETGLTPDKIKDSLKRIIMDKGSENQANAKRVEIVLDDMLTNGFNSVLGESIPPIKPYINLKSKIEGKQIIPKAQNYDLPLLGDNINNLNDELITVDSFANKNILPRQSTDLTNKIRQDLQAQRFIEGKNLKVQPQYKTEYPYMQIDKPYTTQNKPLFEPNNRITPNQQNNALNDFVDNSDNASFESIFEALSGKKVPPPEKPSMFQNPSKKVTPIAENEVLQNTPIEQVNPIEQTKPVENIPRPIEPIPQQEIPQLETSGVLKESKLKTNTLRNAEWLSSSEGQQFVDDVSATYGVKPNEQSIRNANTMLDNDYEGNLRRIMEKGPTTAEDIAMYGQFSRDLVANGDYKSLKKLTQRVQPDITDKAQALQMLSQVKKGDTLEGAIYNAQKAVNSLDSIMKQTNPKKYAEIMNNVSKKVFEIDNFVKNNSDLLKVNLQNFAEKLKAVASDLPKNYIEKVIKLAESGKYDVEELTEIIKERYKIPSFTIDDTEQMVSHYNDAMKSAKGSSEYRTAMAKMADVMPNKLPKSVADKLHALHSINLFGNTKTWNKIFGGNAGQLASKDIVDTIKTPIDWGLSKLTGTRTATLPSLKTQLQGGKKRAIEVYNDMKQGINTDPFTTEFDARRNNPFDSKIMNYANNKANFMMKIFESPYKQAVYDDVLRQELKVANINSKNQAKKLGTEFTEITEPTQEMKDFALKEAEKVMFHDSNDLTNTLYSFREGANRVGNKALQKLGVKMQNPESFGIGNLMLPVLKTPANMMLRAIEHSPINPKLYGSGFKFIATKGKEGQKEFVDSIAKALFGTGVGYAGYEAGKRGLAFASPDKDKDVNEFNKSIGKQPFSINTPFGNATYDFLQPSATPFSFGAELGQNYKNKNPMATAFDSLINQSVLQSLRTALGGGAKSASPAENIQDALLNSGSQLIPFGSAFNQVSKLADDYKRETDNDPLKRTMARTPLRFMLPKKIGTDGQPEKEDSAFNIFVNPSNIKENRQTGATNELSRLYQESGQKSQMPTKAPEKISKKGVTVDFSEQEIFDLQQKIGQKTMQEFEKVIETSKYKNAKANDKKSADEVKADILSKKISDIKEKAINDLLKSKGLSTKTLKPIRK